MLVIAVVDVIFAVAIYVVIFLVATEDSDAAALVEVVVLIACAAIK